MSYRVIREYGPCLQLAEDEESTRFLLLDHGSKLTLDLWIRAREDGALGVMVGWPEVPFMVIGPDQVMEVLEGKARGTIINESLSFFDALTKQIVSTPEITAFTHLHTHSEYSPLDGLSRMEELAAKISEEGGQALAITDHGTCAGHPALQAACDKYGLRPIFGIEAYFVDDRHERATPESTPEEARRIRYGYNHLILLAKNDEGLRNIWALSTEGWREGEVSGTPRIDWDSLQRHREGVICTTACLGGPLSDLIVKTGDLDGAIQRLSRLKSIFGEDLYLEIQPNDIPEQIALNEVLVELSEIYDVPLVAAVDSHYVRKDDEDLHTTWLKCQLKEVKEDYWHLAHCMSEQEARESFHGRIPDKAIEQAITNTAYIASQCNARIPSKIVMPVFHRQGGHERDAERLHEICEANWHRIRPGRKYSEQDYRERFEREYDLLSRKLYCGYFLMVADYVVWAKENGILVGPGRGSGAGSLIAFLLRITEVDPVEHEILFERFITEGRKTLPDFDVDFPQSKRSVIQNYLRDKYGDDHTLRIGTHLRYKNKGIVQKLFSAYGPELPPEAFSDAKAISTLISEAEAGTAGLGLSWEELWSQIGEDLEPFRRKYPQIFSRADELVGRLYSYGRHAAGIVISTEEPLTDRLPLRSGGEGEQMISQFDMEALDFMGYIKFDILTIRTLDTLQVTVDTARKHYGLSIDVYAFEEEYEDPLVWDRICEGYTLGMFQIETTSGTKLVKRLKPRSIADLADVGALVRPGPTRSGLTETYLVRRDGLEAVVFPDPRMEEFLSSTQGVLVYQEQVMQTAMILAGYDSTEADGVRKILGKKKVDQVVEAGHKFTDGCVAHGMDRQAAETLWSQMAEFAKYGFGKAHSVAYGMITYWTAWLLVHYPVPTLTALLCTVDKERIPEFVQQARKIGIHILPPDINASGKGFRPEGITIRYGLDSIKGVGEKAVDNLELCQPFADFADFLERKDSRAVNSGVVQILAKVGAFDSIEPHRKALVQRLEAESDGSAVQCVFKDPELQGPNGLPCTFDWESEPRPVNKRTGKLLKAKPLPKKCTKACRQYTAPEPVELSLVEPYTAREIRQIEQEMLGLQLSSTPFEVFAEEDRKDLRDFAELLDKGMVGVYMIAGTISRVRHHVDRAGRKMAFFNLVTESTDVNIAAFAEEYATYHLSIQEGFFGMAEVKRDSGGVHLRRFHRLDT